MLGYVNITIEFVLRDKGSRSFQKVVKCNFSSRHKWSTALLYSIFLGGFGADRFYLGYIGINNGRSF
jgi:hypothetical protein